MDLGSLRFLRHTEGVEEGAQLRQHPLCRGALIVGTGHHFWWGSVFLVNVPVVAVALLAGWPLVPESRDPRATPLDPVGAGLSIAALVALVYGIIEAPAKGWNDPLILGSFGIAALLSVVFIWWERPLPHWRLCWCSCSSRPGGRGRGESGSWLWRSSEDPGMMDDSKEGRKPKSVCAQEDLVNRADAFILDVGEAALLGDAAGLLADDSTLEPESLRPDRDRFARHRGSVLRSTEHVDDVGSLGQIHEGGEGPLAEDVILVWVHGNDSVSDLLEIPGNAVRVTAGITRETDDCDGPRRPQNLL